MKHLVTFLLLTVVAGQQASSHWDHFKKVDKNQYSGVEDWDHFKQVYKKQYSDVEEELGRKQIFESSVSYVGRHNALYEQGKVTFKVGLNNFSDWTRAEMESRYLMTDFMDDDREVLNELEEFDEVEADVSDTSSPPSSHDWRDAGIVTGIKDQGGCGSCWAFAAVGAIEAAWAKDTGALYSLSEQELIDCGTGDCGGGWSWAGFETVMDMGGIMGEDAYPYTGTDQGHCRYQDEFSMARISSYKHVPSEPINENKMAKNLFEHSPIAVSIDASLYSFQSYTSGIYYDPDCSTSMTNHIVLIVGYNMEAQNEDEHYWIVKNSWGTWWGMDGYIHMKMWVNNCNIARWGYFPKV